MSLELEQIMARELRGRFFSRSEEGSRIVESRVSGDYIPQHANPKIGAFRPWSDKDDEAIIEARHRSLTWAEVGKVVRRSHVNCRERYHALCQSRGIRPVTMLARKEPKNPVKAPRRPLIVESPLPPPARITPVELMPTLTEIVAAVSYVTQIGAADMKSACRRAAFIQARMLYYWVARNYTPNSFPDIGRFCGKRDHSTVLHGVSNVDRNFAEYKAAINRVLEVLGLELMA